MLKRFPSQLASVTLATALFGALALAQTQQPQAQPVTDSVADAARKAKADRPKGTSKKVFTDEDLPSLKSGGLSVVGEKESGAASAEATQPNAKPAGGAAAKTQKDEAYWRGRAQKIREQMNAVDQDIDKVKEAMKKGGGSGFDMQTGLNQNVAYIEDRNAKLKALEQKKSELQKQMDALEEEARQADVPIGWLR